MNPSTDLQENVILWFVWKKSPSLLLKNLVSLWTNTLCLVLRTYLLTSIAPRCQGSVGSIVGLIPGVISLSPGESVAGAHQGRHSKSSQYRRMKAEWKSNVYLARSRIQVRHVEPRLNTAD